MRYTKEIDSMFRKAIIAASLLGLASTAAASTLVTSPAAGVVKSEQGILTSVAVAGASYTVTSEVAIASGSTLQTTYSAAPTNAAAISATVASCGAGASVTYSGTTNAGKTLNYTVANTANPATLPIGCALAIGAVANKAPAFAKADVQAASITTIASWTVVGAGVDPVVAAKPVLKMLGKDQFGLVVTTKANQEVDVNALRKAYTTGTDDVILLTYKDFAGGATDSKAIITLTGDFAWADDPQTAAFDVGVRRGQTPIAVAGWALGDGTTAPKPTATTLSLYKATPANNDTATITFTPLVTAGAGTVAITDDHAAVSLPAKAFTVSMATTFTDEVAAPNTGAGVQNVKAASAGAWTLNGASVKVFSIPFGPEVESHSIFVSNSGATKGEITGSMTWAGNTAVEFSLGNVEAGANRYLNVMDTLAALGEKPPYGRADITFTVNSPAADITFTAAYTTATGRANLFMQEQANIATVSNAAKTSAAAAAADAAIACDNVIVAEANLDDITGSTLAFGTSAGTTGNVIAAGAAVSAYTATGAGAAAAALTACP
jgi:hypothetical protein